VATEVGVERLEEDLEGSDHQLSQDHLVEGVILDQEGGRVESRQGFIKIKEKQVSNGYLAVIWMLFTGSGH